MDDDVAPEPHLQRFEMLTIDRRARQAWIGSEPADLTRSEYALLIALVDHPGRAMSNRELLEAMWGSEWRSDTTALQVHVSRLRGKIGESGSHPRHVLTVHGYGYRFESQPSRLSSGVVEDDAARVAYVLTSMDRVIEWASYQVATVLGWEPGTLVGTVLYDLVHDDDVVTWRDARVHLDAGQPGAFLGRIRDGSGRFRLVEALARPILSDGGQVTGFIGEFRPARNGEGPVAADLQPIRLTREPRHPDPPPIELGFDRDLILREIVPAGPVLGWQPEEILGTAFSPSGIATDALVVVVQGLIASRQLVVRGPVPVYMRSGEIVTAHVESQIDLDADGQFAGLRSRISAPWPSAGGDL